MKKIIRNEREYSELIEVFDVINDCHHFQYSDALRARALSQCENPDMINQVIERIGAEIRVPTVLMRQLLFEAVGEFYEPVILGELLMQYWCRYLMKTPNPQQAFSVNEHLIIREFFIYFLKLKSVKEDYCIFEFKSPIEKDELLLCI